MKSAKKGIIQSIAFYVSNAYEFNCSELKIYMGETDLTQLSTSSAFTSNGLQLVYSGTDVSIGSTTGWETIEIKKKKMHDWNWGNVGSIYAL